MTKMSKHYSKHIGNNNKRRRGKAQNGQTIRVQGAPNITMWKNSWNEQGYTELALDDSGNNATGYNVRLATANANSNSDISLGSYSGYSDTLYFPYKNTTAGNGNANKAEGYWLASPGGSYSSDVCSVGYYGFVYCNYIYN